MDKVYANKKCSVILSKLDLTFEGALNVFFFFLKTDYYFQGLYPKAAEV